jgi:hypothetical protein
MCKATIDTFLGYRILEYRFDKIKLLIILQGPQTVMLQLRVLS